jgi:hypothetical protein
MAASFTCDACGTARTVRHGHGYEEGPGAIPDGWLWVMVARQPRQAEQPGHACSAECAVDVARLQLAALGELVLSGEPAA